MHQQPECVNNVAACGNPVSISSVLKPWLLGTDPSQSESHALCSGLCLKSAVRLFRLRESLLSLSGGMKHCEYLWGELPLGAAGLMSMLRPQYTPLDTAAVLGEKL